ncbi:hypothetical protein ES707_20010 [subsurface metagenome]
MKQEEIEQLAEKISIDRAAIDHARILADAEAALEKSRRPEITKIRALSWDRLPRLVWAGGLAAAFLIIVSALSMLIFSANCSISSCFILAFLFQVRAGPAGYRFCSD